MALAGRRNVHQAAHGTFRMKMLLSLITLLFVTWSRSNTEALPVQTNKLPNSNEVLTKDQKNLLTKILADLAELNMTVKELGALDIEELLSGKLGERPALDLPPAREKSPCKNFFWKTFYAC